MQITNSDRLSFQLIDESDAKFLFALDQDPEVMRYINGGKATSFADIENKFIPRLNAYKNVDKGWGQWKVSTKDNQQAIGWVLVRPMDFFSDKPIWNNIELGWRFFKNVWGQGYASEAAQHILDILAKDANNQFFSAIAMQGNLGSIGVMKKIGMQYIKTYLHQDSQLGEVNAELYRLKNPYAKHK